MLFELPGAMIAALIRPTMAAASVPSRTLKMLAAPWQFSQASGTPLGIATGVLYSVAPVVGLPTCASADPLNPTTASAATVGGSDRR